MNRRQSVIIGMISVAFITLTSVGVYLERIRYMQVSIERSRDSLLLTTWPTEKVDTVPEIDQISFMKLGSLKDSVVSQLKRKKITFKSNKSYDNIGWSSVYNYYDCNGASLITIPKFTHSNITFSDLQLEFYHDTLYFLHLSNTPYDLKEAISIAYHPYIRLVDSERVTCRYTYTGAENDHYSVVITYVFRDDQDIKCYEIESYVFNEKCKLEMSDKFMLFNDFTFNRVKRQCELSMKMYNEEATKSKIEKYKDFK